MAAMRQCEMCRFGATTKCDYCSALVCPEHYENVAVKKGYKEGSIVLQACVACTPEAMRVREERAERARAAREAADRKARLLLLERTIADPTTPLDRRAEALAHVAFVKYVDYISLLILCAIGIGLLLLTFWTMMCTVFVIDDDSALVTIFHCGEHPIELLCRFAHC